MTDVLDEITPDHTTDAPKAPDAQNWRQEDHDGTLTLWLDCAGTGTNIISEAVLRELDTLLDAAKQARPDVLAIRSAKPGGFGAGADIDVFAGLSGEDAVAMLRQGHAVLDKLAALPVPTVAVVHGTTLGGAVAQSLILANWRGMTGKEDFKSVQEASPVLASMGLPEQRATVSGAGMR